jgi:undecaprenyl-diphosphatase
MDHSLVASLNHFLVAHDGIEDPVSLYEKLAELLFAGGLVLAFVLAVGRGRREIRRTALAAGLSAGVALLLAQVIAGLVDRPRPFVADPSQIHLFAPHAADAGFPSDHATAAFAIAVAVLLRNRTAGLLVLIPATLLAVGRVAIGVHYPTDVLAGAVLGALVALALWPQSTRALLDRLADTIGGVFDMALKRA